MPLAERRARARLIAPSSLRWAVIVAAFSAGACDCGDGGELRKVLPELEVSPTSIEFGEVPLLASKHATINLSNTGTAPLVVSRVLVAEPFRASLDLTEIPAGQVGHIEVTFTPTTADSAANGRLVIESNASALPIAEVGLTGRGVPSTIDIFPREIIFDPTTVGTDRTQEVVISNRGLEPAAGDLVPEGFARPGHFSMSGLTDFQTATPLNVPARGQVQLAIEYHPIEAAVDEGRIRFEVCGPRCGYELRVRGDAIGSILRLEPAFVDFGPSALFESTSREIAVVNDGTDAVTIEGVGISGASDFSATHAGTTPFRLEGGSRLQVVVDFTPSRAALVEAQLVVRTDDQAVPELRGSLQGLGQGPLFLVQPDHVDFGVQIDDRASRRPLLLLNGGSTPVSVRSISLAGDTAFSLVDVPGLPVSLGSGESITPFVEFLPVDQREYTGTLNIETDDAENLSVQIPVTGAYAEEACQLEIQPARVLFGLVPPGYTQRRFVRVQNTGVQDCVLTSGAFSAPQDPAMSTGATFPLTIPVGGAHEFAFEYTPTERKESKVSYVLTTDDEIAPNRTLSLIGTSEAYEDVFVLPERVDFGSMKPGCSAVDRHVTLFNGGTVWAELTSLTLTSSSAEFLRPVLATPAVLSAGSSIRIDLGYSATNLGADRGELELAIRGRTFPITVPLSGAGAIDPLQVETFRQSTVQKADVLFVIDDSCSMRGEQDALARNFNSFIRSAALRNVDFQIGITTTDTIVGLLPAATRRGGELVGPILRPNTPNLEGQFRTQINVGVTGSPVEEGLEAMLLAFQLDEAGYGANAGMFRRDAARAIVFVSDEDDQSISDPVVYFNELRRRATNFVVAGVTGQGIGCFDPVTNDGALPAPRYQAFFQITNAIDESICANWARALQNIGNAAFGLQTRFTLSRSADMTHPISVRVNGQPAANWTYDVTGPAIEFSAPPAEGALIEIQYTPGC